MTASASDPYLFSARDHYELHFDGRLARLSSLEWISKGDQNLGDAYANLYPDLTLPSIAHPRRSAHLLRDDALAEIFLAQSAAFYELAPALAGACAVVLPEAEQQGAVISIDRDTGCFQYNRGGAQGCALELGRAIGCELTPWQRHSGERFVALRMVSRTNPRPGQGMLVGSPGYFGFDSRQEAQSLTKRLLELWVPILYAWDEALAPLLRDHPAV